VTLVLEIDGVVAMNRSSAPRALSVVAMATSKQTHQISCAEMLVVGNGRTAGNAWRKAGQRAAAVQQHADGSID
jgi:hypothetical protein